MWFKLTQLIDLVAPYPFRAAVRSEPGGKVAVVQMQEATCSAKLSESVPRVANQDGKYDRYLLKPGDLLIQARGFHNPVGLVSIDLPVIAAPGLHTLRPHLERILPEYLAWCLNHPRTQSTIAAAAQGTHAPFISKQALGAIQIPVPSLATQHRIVEVNRLRQNERRLTVQLSEAQDLLVNETTWQAAIAS